MDDPAALLLAGWLSARLGLPVPVEQAAGRAPGVGGIGVSAVTVDVDDGSTVRLVREDARTVLLQRAGQPDSEVTLPERELGDLLAEELRRLDADQPYGDALGQATGVPGLNDRPDEPRTHIWVDPMLQNGGGQGASGVPGSPGAPQPPAATAAETDRDTGPHGEGQAAAGGDASIAAAGPGVPEAPGVGG
jgi:Glucose-6-phosphate dehydrogenase subunit C-terminal domain